MVEGRSKAALSRFFIEQGPRWCQNVKTVVTDGSHLLSGSRPTLSSHSPSRPGPLPRRPMVRPGADPGTPGTATPPTDRCETRFRTGPVPRPFLSATQKRPPNRRRPETPRTAIRRSSASSGGLGRSTTLRRPLRNRPDSRVPQHRRHHPQLGRRNPQLAPQPPFQRTPRRHQQPNPNPPQNRPRLHQPPKLRRPRTPPNMNPTTNQPDHNPTISRRAAKPPNPMRNQIP